MVTIHSTCVLSMHVHLRINYSGLRFILYFSFHCQEASSLSSLHPLLESRGIPLYGILHEEKGATSFNRYLGGQLLLDLKVYVTVFSSVLFKRISENHSMHDLTLPCAATCRFCCCIRP